MLVITHDPALQTQGGKRLHEHFNWQDPAMLVEGFINDLAECSYGYVLYRVVEHIVVNGFPVKADGFQYTEETYLQAWATGQFHQPDAVDYYRLLNDFNLIGRINSGEIDEVWLMGHPYGGYYESIMVGPEAFWCNAPPLANTDSANRQFIIMGFNFERRVGEMLESYGHRIESIMERVYQGVPEAENMWHRFIRYDQTSPGKAECGTVHFAPNSVRDYDWGNTHTVLSRCDIWYNYPNLDGDPRQVDSTEWGSGDPRLHHTWWMNHFPHGSGESGQETSENWWKYIIDPNNV
ncbi:MAG: hypothetical protein H6672_18915 [Anaerolineaceae bacterium]|nr:hypothetical protein [Anaerolineaceae bacterium]